MPTFVHKGRLNWKGEKQKISCRETIFSFEDVRRFKVELVQRMKSWVHENVTTQWVRQVMVSESIKTVIDGAGVKEN